MDIGVYCVHPMVKLFGLPNEISAHCLKLSNGVDASGTIVAMYDEMQAELMYSKITNSALPSQIQGEEASMIIKEIPDTTTDRDCVPQRRKRRDQNRQKDQQHVL